MKKLLLIALFFPFLLPAQKALEPDQIKTFNITVNYDDFTVKTQMLKDPKKIKVKNELVYLWFDSHKVIETRGGFDGKLIHGYYKSFYLNNQLREMGEVKYGLKNGTWKTWYADGNLKEIINYCKGRKYGHYELYNEYGRLMASGHFRNDLLHGKFYTYDNLGKVTETKKYRRGSELVKKVRKKKEKLPKKEEITKPSEETAKDKPQEETPVKKSKKKDKANEKNKDTQTKVKKKKSFAERVKGLFRKKSSPGNKTAKESKADSHV